MSTRGCTISLKAKINEFLKNYDSDSLRTMQETNDFMKSIFFWILECCGGVCTCISIMIINVENVGQTISLKWSMTGLGLSVIWFSHEGGGVF